ncbi:MAG: PspC domain-containing protein [Ignavibacteriales bacterium]|nr:PspC domain-containing protein [Ignavibacteriales bacterium]
MEERQKIYRSRTNRVLGGVCAGLGNYLNLDPVLIRIIFVVLVIAAGSGVLIYIILWIIIPEEPVYIQQSTGQTIEPKDVNENVSQGNYTQSEQVIKTKNGSGRMIFGVILIIVGLMFLFETLFDFLDFEYLGPIILILIGVALLYNSFQIKGEK